MNATACPTREVLLAFHTGKLPEPAAEEVIAHIGQCAACEAILNSFGEAEDGLIARLRRQSIEQPYTAEPQYLELVQRAKAMVATSDAQETPSSHPSRDQLEAYARGELAGSVANVVAEHVEQCAGCEATLSNLASEEGTAVGKRQGVAGQPSQGGNPQRQQPDNVSGRAGPPPEMPRTELFDHSPSPSPALPTQLREYRVLERLGAGGMGTVYKALHTRLDKLVALKVLPAAAMQDAELLARFDREMKAVGKLEHPNIVRAMDAGCHEGTHFLVMEYVDGMDLAQVVKRCGPLRIADACEVIRQAALGLRHADEHALVHRDIKPSNLVLSPDGAVKILDLGLALLEKERISGEEATGRGRAMGTLDYMAPEQVRDSHSVDIRADIYSLGCTFYKLLTGQVPFGGPQHENTFDKMMAHLSEPVPPVRHLRPDVPEKLATVLERMVAKDRDGRYAKPGQVVEDLKPFCPGCDLAGLLIRARQESQAPAAESGPPSPALGAGLPTPPKRPTARSPEPPPRPPVATSPSPTPRSPLPTPPSQPSTPFDPYYRWLAIPPDEQPPNHYRLLGLRVFEENRDVIQAAAERQTVFLRNVALGKHSRESQQLLNEVHKAKLCLLTPEDKAAYDARLRKEMAAKAASAPAPAALGAGKLPSPSGRGAGGEGAGPAALGAGLPTPPSQPTARSPAASAALGAGLPTPPDQPTAGSPTGSAAEDERAAYARVLGDMVASRPAQAQPARAKARSTARMQAYLRRVPPYAWIAGSCAAAALLLGVVIYVTTDKGTVRIELSDPTAKVEVKVDGNQIDIAGPENPLRLSVGEHSLVVTSGEFQTVTDKFIITRGRETPFRVDLVPKAKPGQRDEFPPLAGAEQGEGKLVVAEGGSKALRPRIAGPAPPLAVAPFDPAKAREHQKAWAEYLGVQVEITNSIGMKLVLIPPGEYDMGSTQQDVERLLNEAKQRKAQQGYLDRLSEETPRHRVRISRPFYLGACEVTQRQYLQIVGVNPSRFKESGPDAPVECLPWGDAAGFCARLSELPAEKVALGPYRLPTEAEWEYACRAGTTTAFCFGDDEAGLSDYAWWGKNSGGKTHPVGQKKPNAFGLFDVHGNVAEFCADWASPGDDYYNLSPPVDPTGRPPSCDYMHRGGSIFYELPGGLRCAYRSFCPTPWVLDQMGFRVVREIVAEDSSQGAAQILAESERTPGTPSGTASRNETKPTASPPLAVAPFDAAKAREHQEAWAKHFGMPAETTNWIGMKLVLIPAGEFQMGTSPEEAQKIREEAVRRNVPDFVIRRIPREVPKHRVRITMPFLMGKCEVTQAEYVALMGRNPSRFSAYGANKEKVAGTDTNRLPVEGVSWADAEEFCFRLSSLPAERAAGRRYRLPTEAEWEYACRAGTTTTFHSGNEDADLNQVGWWADSGADGRPHPVGMKGPNSWRLCDMHGNVWEWCADWLGEGYYRSSPLTDPAGPAMGQVRVVRGGGWSNTGSIDLTSAHRSDAAPEGAAFEWTGFRVVCTCSRATGSTNEDVQAELDKSRRPAIMPPLAVAPFDAAAARKHQEAWAKHLSVPVEITSSIGVKLVLIPPGEFLMGSPDSDSEAQTGEKPQHRARITKPFLLGVHEVTVGQFRQFAQSGEYKGSDVWKTAFASQTDDHPVVNVNWDEARAFCHWLSRGERQTYRLPSEAEWEYACRAGSTTKYCFGDGDAQLGDYAWCGSNAGGHTHPVGQKKPNAWGLHDMHGNVWEWCADWCDAGYYSQSLRDDPSGPSSGVDRVLRGGSWHPWAAHTRSGLRLGNHPVSRLPDFGFRVARTCDGATASTATEGSRSGAGGKLADPEAMSGRVTRP